MTVQAHPLRIDILHEHAVVASHPRCYDCHQDIFDPLHYLPLLEQRPRRFEHARPIRQSHGLCNDPHQNPIQKP